MVKSYILGLVTFVIASLFLSSFYLLLLSLEVSLDPFGTDLHGLSDPRKAIGRKERRKTAIVSLRKVNYKNENRM